MYDGSVTKTGIPRPHVRGRGKGEITMETVNKIIEIFNSQSVAAVAAGDYEPVKP